MLSPTSHQRLAIHRVFERKRIMSTHTPHTLLRVTPHTLLRVTWTKFPLQKQQPEPEQKLNQEKIFHKPSASFVHFLFDCRRKLNSHLESLGRRVRLAFRIRFEMFVSYSFREFSSLFFRSLFTESCSYSIVFDGTRIALNKILFKFLDSLVVAFKFSILENRTQIKNNWKLWSGEKLVDATQRDQTTLKSIFSTNKQ